MCFGYPETFARKTLVAGFHVITSLLRDDDVPKVENFPQVEITMTYGSPHAKEPEQGGG